MGGSFETDGKCSLILLLNSLLIHLLQLSKLDVFLSRQLTDLTSRYDTLETLQSYIRQQYDGDMVNCVAQEAAMYIHSAPGAKVPLF